MTGPDSAGVTASDGPALPAAPRTALSRLCAGIALAAIVFILGACARLVTVTQWGLGIDDAIADHRTPTLTLVATILTTSATPEIVGPTAIILIPAVLVFTRRLVDALEAFCVIGGSVAFALIAKTLIAEPRPPVAVWAIPADAGTSYPSGHTTVAASIVAAFIVSSRSRRWRTAVIISGGIYVVGVATSRIYLANHYPVDVTGSLITAVSLTLTITGLARLPALSAHLARLRQTSSD